jgi:hypothetical protein
MGCAEAVGRRGGRLCKATAVNKMDVEEEEACSASSWRHIHTHVKGLVDASLRSRN